MKSCFHMPISDASDEAKLELDSKLIASNIVFRKYFDLVKENLLSNHMSGVKVNLKYGKLKFKRELLDAYTSNPNKIVVRDVFIPYEDFVIINNIKNLEIDVLSIYGKLLIQQAHWWHNVSRKSFDFEEAYQECVIATLSAIWGGFSKSNIKFITFLHTTIRNRFYYVTNQNKPLSPWNIEDRKILGNFKKLQNENPNASFSEIAYYMNLDETQIQNLRSMLRLVSNESSLQNNENEFGFDNLIADKKETEVSFDVMQLLEDFEMSSWERICVNAYLNGRRGWAAEVARENINPATNTIYSRAAPQIAVDRVLERFKKKHCTLSVK